VKRYVLTGVGIWAAATVALRVAGQYLLTTNAGGVALLLVASLVVMIGVAALVLRRCRDSGERARAAIALVTPGMLLDSISAIGFSRFFPNIDAGAAGLFGGWLLFCNAVVLIAALCLEPRANEP